MRTYIFTEDEVEKLRLWLETGEEDRSTRVLFTRIRRNLPGLRRQVELLLAVARRLRAEGRLRGRMTPHRGLGFALRRAESALTLLRRGSSTSIKSRS